MEEKPVNLNVADRDFKYYIFDWDDNILHMPTRIHLERLTPEGRWVPHIVSTAAFAVLKKDKDHYRPPSGDWNEAFREFQDNEGETESHFLLDTRAALEKVMRGEAKPGPSFQTLRKTLREGRLFAIVTARGHEPGTLKKAVRLFLDVVLSEQERADMLAALRGYRLCFDHVEPHATDEEEIEYYLSLNRYHAVTNPRFLDWMQKTGTITERAQDASARKEQTAEAKRFAIRDFIEHVIGILEKMGADGLRNPISVGFSDDDKANVQAVVSFIQSELSARFPGIKFCVYDTSDPDIAAGRKLIVSGQLDFGF